MQACKKFQFSITYLNNHYPVDVTEFNYPNQYTIYKIKLMQGKYWFIKNDKEWRCITDFQLTPKLKNRLIHKIETMSDTDKQLISMAT